MIHDRQIKHAGILHRPAHHFVILHTLPVIRDGNDAFALQGTNGSKLFTGQPLGDGRLTILGFTGFHWPQLNGLVRFDTLRDKLLGDRGTAGEDDLIKKIVAEGRGDRRQHMAGADYQGHPQEAAKGRPLPQGP